MAGGFGPFGGATDIASVVGWAMVAIDARTNISELGRSESRPIPAERRYFKKAVKESLKRTNRFLPILLL